MSIAQTAVIPGPSHDAIPEALFYIPATGVSVRPRRTLKYNDTFAVFDSHGDIGATAGGPDGLFDSDTRFLSHLELLLNGAQPLLLGSAIKDNNLALYVDLTNPDFYSEGRISLLKDTVHVARTIYLCDGTLHERIAVVNHGPADVRFTLSLTFASDFADLFEVRGIRRAHRGKAWKEILGPGSIALRYKGLDGKLRETVLTFEPAPTVLLESIGSYALHMPRAARTSLFISASCRDSAKQSTVSFFTDLKRSQRQRSLATSGVATVETPNRVLNEILSRCMADLYMLITSTPEGPYPYAGIPWFSTTFGRDGLITAMQMLWFDPSIAVGVLKRLSKHQATTVDPSIDAEPGKILHEMRGGEMAALGEIPFGLYYGSVDSTPLFVMLAGYYAKRTGDYALIGELWPAIERALAWIDGPGDRDGDGFIEYQLAAERGLSNQGWKDSHDSVFHADGRLAEGPIALVEPQAYVYAARRLAAECARKLGYAERAAQLEAQAEALRARFEEAFWCEEIGTYALALDGSKAQCKVRTSNAGHALFTAIASPDRARRVVQSLLDARFYSGWGIRTVAMGEARYNPMSYHNGSVWPHDNAVIAHGFAQYGYKKEIRLLFEALIRATSYMDHRRLPELFCGFRRRRGRGPTLYPLACAPQAWSSGAPFMMLQSLLGLEFDPVQREIRLINPSVPASAGEIVVRNLRLGEASADFAVRQEGQAVSLQVLRTIGNIRVALVVDTDRTQPGGL
jgi:glycogen debranching enzyme